MDPQLVQQKFFTIVPVKIYALRRKKMETPWKIRPLPMGKKKYVFYRYFSVDFY